MIGERYVCAVSMAAFAHGEQTRKGTDIPYISHPLAVSALVMQFGGDEDQAIIAVCHDMVEDCGRRWEHTIRSEFGDRCANGVLGCSDDAPDEAGGQKLPWEARKRRYLAHLATADADVLLVSLCDKLHNAGCIVSDLEVHGPSVFERFRAKRDGTIWYYSELRDAFRRRRDKVPGAALRQFSDMVARMKALADGPGPRGRETMLSADALI